MKWPRRLIVSSLALFVLTSTSHWLADWLTVLGYPFVQAEYIAGFFTLLAVYIGTLYRKYWRFDVFQSVNRIPADSDKTP